MGRYTSLLLTAFTLFLVVLAGSAYLAGAGHKEIDKPMREITAYTTLPAATAALLSDAYEKESRVRVNFIPLSQQDLLKRLEHQVSEDGKMGASLVLADAETLRKASAAGDFRPYVSEMGDAVADAFKQSDGYWTGVWYDPVVFCVNKDYLKSLTYIPDNWTELSEMQNVRIGVTDFMAADAAANLLYSMIAQYGDGAAYQIWRQIHPNVVQYTKYLSNPVRQAGMGEADISVVVQSEALRYINEGYPLKVIYPADGTAYLLSGTALVKGASAEQSATAESFADWLLSDEAQLALQKNNFFFVATNPGTIAYKSFAGKNLVLYSQIPDFTPQQKHDFLDRWVKYIRFQ